MHKIGSFQLRMYYKGKEIKNVNAGLPLPILQFEAGPCYAEDNSHIYYSSIEGFITTQRVSFKFKCFDIYNNEITKGGENFTIKGNIKSDTQNVDLNTLEIEDNKDGTYTISFIPKDPAEYIIRLFKDGEKYGNDILLNFTEYTCSRTKPILCSNNICAKDYLSCIQPPNGCDINKPFKCKVNGKEMCVKSQTDCDCPEK